MKLQILVPLQQELKPALPLFHLSPALTRLLSAQNVSGSSGPKVTKLASAISQADNLVIFGLPEVESLPALKNSVDELLSFLVGRSVSLRDLFRLGCCRKISDSRPPGRPRPVLLKFMSTWDHRLVMSAVSKLKEFKMSGLYIREDLSPEERQKHRDRFRSRKAIGAGSNPDDSDNTLHSQPLIAQSQSLSPCDLPSSVSGSSGSPTQDAQ